MNPAKRIKHFEVGKESTKDKRSMLLSREGGAECGVTLAPLA